jgi:hypothetical protein
VYLKYLKGRALEKVEPDPVMVGKTPLLEQYEQAKIDRHFKNVLGFGYIQNECIDVMLTDNMQLSWVNERRNKVNLTKVLICLFLLSRTVINRLCSAFL